MAAKIVVSGEDFIDMEVSSYFPLSSSQTTQPGSEFEFHMSSSSFMNNIENERMMMRSCSSAEAMLASPADELFYKGKLLPLHLPPRLQMVEKLLHNSNLHDQKRIFEEDDDDGLIFSTPLTTTAKPTPTTTTCNTPLFESCHVSRELNPEEYVFEFNDCDQQRKNNNNNSSRSSSNKKSWTRKLVGSTLKASRSYLKSLFGKSSSLAGGSSCESYYAVSSTTKVADESSVTNSSKGFNNNKNTSKSSGNNNNTKKVPFGQIQRTSGNGSGSSSNSNRHRRSFSVGLKLMQSSNNKSSSFLVGNKSLGSSIIRGGGHQKLKRCCSTNSDRENSIQGAIAHCKKSHEIISDVFSASARSVCDDQQQKRPEICRG